MRRIRFQKQLLLGVFALLSTLILLGGGIVCGVAIHNEAETEQDTMEQIAERISLQVDGIYRQMGIAVTATVTNPQLKSIVFELNTLDTLTEYDQLRYKNTIIETMTKNLFYLADAQNAFLYNPNRSYCYYTGLYLWDETSLQRHAEDDKDYQALTAACPDSYLLLPPHRNPWNPDGKPVISAVKRFFDSDRVENALFEVQLPCTVLDEVCNQETFSDLYQIIIFDGEGNQLYPYNTFPWVLEQEDIPGVWASIQQGRDSAILADYRYAAQWSGYTGWYTCLVGNTQSLHARYRQYALMAVLLVSLVTGATFAVLALLTRRLTRPLDLLTEKVRNVSLDNFGLDWGTDTPDELAALDESFQIMFRKLHESIQENYELRLRESNANLQALQSQINPHFLYNTLNSIGSAARLYGSETAAEMCQNLANMMRYITKKSKNNVLGDELAHTRNYLALCQIPYRDQFQYNISVPEAMYSLQLPRLSVQPIVENAVTHGLEQISPPYEVSVMGRIDGEGRWHLTVANNGTHFSEEKIDELYRFVENYKLTPQSTLDANLLDVGGLGLKNIFARLLIVFNGDVEFSITNHETGCSVEITGPSQEAAHDSDICG